MNTLYISPVTYFCTDNITVSLYINGVLIQTWPQIPVQDDSGSNIQDDSNNLITD